MLMVGGFGGQEPLHSPHYLHMVMRAAGRFGVVPTRLCSDNGSCFVPEHAWAAIRTCVLKPVRGRPNNPRSQGIVERHVHVCKDFFAKHAAIHKYDAFKACSSIMSGKLEWGVNNRKLTYSKNKSPRGMVTAIMTSTDRYEEAKFPELCKATQHDIEWTPVILPNHEYEQFYANSPREAEGSRYRSNNPNNIKTKTKVTAQQEHTAIDNKKERKVKLIDLMGHGELTGIDEGNRFGSPKYTEKTADSQEAKQLASMFVQKFQEFFQDLPGAHTLDPIHRGQGMVKVYIRSPHTNYFQDVSCNRIPMEYE